MSFQDFFVDYGIVIAYILVILCFSAAILLPIIISLVSDPKSLLKPIIGIIVLAVIFLIGYSVSGNEVTEVYATFGVDAPLSKSIGGVLSTMYILVFGSIILLILGELSKIFK